MAEGDNRSSNLLVSPGAVRRGVRGAGFAGRSAGDSSLPARFGRLWPDDR